MVFQAKGMAGAEALGWGVPDKFMEQKQHWWGGQDAEKADGIGPCTYCNDFDVQF